MADGAQNLVGDSWKYDQDYHRLSEFLGVDKNEREDFGLANKISIIRDWAGINDKKPTLESVANNIHGLKKKLGTQNLGQTLVNELYQAIRLDLDGQRNKKQSQQVPQKIELRKQEKPQGIKQVIAQTIQQSVSGMVKAALQDKKLVEQTIKGSIAEALK